MNIKYSSATPETHDNKKTEKEGMYIPYNSATPETHVHENKKNRRRLFLMKQSIVNVSVVGYRPCCMDGS